MNDPSAIQGTGMDVVNGCLIVPISGDMELENTRHLGRSILAQVNTKQIKGVIINVSAIRVMDSYGFTVLRNTARAIAMVGAMTVFVGFQPGVASSLIDLDLDMGDIHTAVTTQDAFELMKNRIQSFRSPGEHTDQATPELHPNSDCDSYDHENG